MDNANLGQYQDQTLIDNFNLMYKMPQVTPEGMAARILQFTSIMRNELDEGGEIIQAIHGNWIGNAAKDRAMILKEIPDATDEEIIQVMLADWFADLMVYAASEGRRFDQPSFDYFRIVMQSNFSKMGADGRPIYDQNMKLEKGPNYWKPEPMMLRHLRKLHAAKTLQIGAAGCDLDLSRIQTIDARSL